MSKLESLPLESSALTPDTAPVEIMELTLKLLGEVFWTELYQMTRLNDVKCPFGSWRLGIFMAISKFKLVCGVS